MQINPVFIRKFTTLKFLDPSSLNAQIRTCVQQGLYSDALKLYSSIINSSPEPNRFTFPCLLKACAALFDLNHGKTIHKKVLEVGLKSDSYIASSLISMYAKCGSLSDAIQVFEEITEPKNSQKDVTIWNAMIDGYFQNGCYSEGVVTFHQMQLSGIKPDGFSLSIVLGCCSIHLKAGKQIHGFIVTNFLGHDDPFLETALIDMYCKCGRPIDAWQVFELISNKHIFAWNAMIGGFAQNGLWERSMELFKMMKYENCKLGSTALSSVLMACSHGDALVFGKEVHGCGIKIGFDSEPYFCTSLLTMYSKCLQIEDANKVFVCMPQREVASWNAMISGYIINDCLTQALEIYNLMRLSGLRPDSFTNSNILSACGMMLLHEFGRGVHGDTIKRPAQTNMAVQTSLLTMYAKCGNIEDASLFFSTIGERDLLVWGSMIAGFCQNMRFYEALKLFKAMEVQGSKPDATIIASILAACAGLEYLELGCQVHGFVIQSGNCLDIFVGTALIGMYSKCGLPETAGSVFSRMAYKNLTTWNSMIAGYASNSHPKQSLKLFAQIEQNGLKPDCVSITSVLAAISSLAALLKGKTLHSYIIRHDLSTDCNVDDALIDMYIKCGSVKDSYRVFVRMPRRDIVAWNSMIAGYGSHGLCVEAIRLFEEMKLSGVMPDETTFLVLISSCSHSGLVDQGFKLFQSMTRDYGIVPKMQHYAAMVDLWGRAGRLDDAYHFIQCMPLEPDESVWLSLLCACRAKHHVELGELAAERLMKLDPTKSSHYITLLNLYGKVGLRDKMAKLRAVMKEKWLKKSPGCSWIEVQDRIDVFFSWDSSCSKAIEVYPTLESLGRNMKEEGNMELVACDILGMEE